MPDSLYQKLRDSLELLKQTNGALAHENSWRDDLNFYFGIAGAIGTILAIYSIYQSYKSKKLQNFVFKQAQIALEKEDAQHKLNATKEELTNVESRIATLQNQIQKDLPIEARKAVLKDRLDESLENLQKYYTDVVTTKKKLSDLGVSSLVSDELLKGIENEIEPRYILKDKISTNQIALTVLSTLSGIAFAAIPYPFGNYIGVTLLLFGLPFLIQVVRYTLIKNSKDKQKVNLTIKLLLNLLATTLTLVSALFFWIVYSTTIYRSAKDDFFLTATILTIITVVFLFFNIRLYKKYKTQNKGS
jgi:hypothetical protein